MRLRTDSHCASWRFLELLLEPMLQAEDFHIDVFSLDLFVWDSATAELSMEEQYDIVMVCLKLNMLLDAQKFTSVVIRIGNFEDAPSVDGEGDPYQSILRAFLTSTETSVDLWDCPYDRRASSFPALL